MTTELEEIRKRIYSIFGEVASTLGYSPMHGMIIGALVVKRRTMSLQEIAAEIGYSSSMISLSLDLLETLDIIHRIKKPGDRKLYVELGGDLLECLKKAVVLKMNKHITTSLKEFEQGKQKVQDSESPKKQEVMQTIESLEKELNRLKMYVDLLSKTQLP